MNCYFDEYRVDAEAFELWRGEERIEIQPQVFELLLFLINNKARIVTKDELFEQVWKGRVVSDATLSSRIKTLRQILGDDGTVQKYIRTIHGRGFRFVAEVRESKNEQQSQSLSTTELKRQPAPTKYAKSGDVHIAYQLFGDGPVDLVVAPGFVSHIENYWDEPHLAHWLGRLGSMARVVIFDKRGTGLSDQVSHLPGMDERMDDVRAVMDAVGFDEAVVMGISEGGSLASLFTATHPGRSKALILYGAFAKFTSWFPTTESLQKLFDYIEASWGSGESLPAFAPSMSNDVSYKTWWGKFERLGANPGAAIALMRMNSQIDISDILPTIRVPALVVHRADDVLIDIEGGRLLAERIPNVQYVELPGVDHLPWVGENSGAILDAIETFLSGTPQFHKVNSVLATILCAKLTGVEGDTTPEQWADLPEECKHTLRDKLLLFGGREVVASGEYYMASFDGPARSIHCALELAEVLQNFNSPVQIGLHTGEVELVNDHVRGIAVDIAVRIASLPRAGEVFVSRTIKDLTAGSGIVFEDCGVQDVGTTEAWRVYRVATPGAP